MASLIFLSSSFAFVLPPFLFLIQLRFSIFFFPLVVSPIRVSAFFCSSNISTLFSCLCSPLVVLPLPFLLSFSSFHAILPSPFSSFPLLFQSFHFSLFFCFNSVSTLFFRLLLIPSAFMPFCFPFPFFQIHFYLFSPLPFFPFSICTGPFFSFFFPSFPV